VKGAAPAIFLMLAFLWQTLWERIGRGAPAFVGLGLTALLLPWLAAIWGRRLLPNLTVSEWLTLSGVAAAALFLGTRDWRWPAMRGILAGLALVLLSGCFTYGLGFYGPVLRTGRAVENLEMDVYRVALQFTEAAPKLTEHPGGVMFWYNNRIANSINSVQSTYLWGYSKINTNPPEDPGLPHLGEFQLQLIRKPEVRYLSLLGETEEELTQGVAALMREGIDFKTADHRVLASGAYRIYFQLVELTHSPAAAAR